MGLHQRGIFLGAGLLLASFALFSLDYNANSLEVNNEQKTISLKGNAMVNTGVDTIRSNVITNYSEENRVEASGNVRITKNDGTRTFQAKSASYNYVDDSFSAKGSGFFKEDKMTINAEEFSGNFGEGIYEAKKKGHLKDSSGDELVQVFADNLRYEAKTKLAFAFGHVKILRGDVTIYSGKAKYDINNKIIEFWEEDDNAFEQTIVNPIFSEKDWQTIEGSWGSAKEDKTSEEGKGEKTIKKEKSQRAVERVRISYVTKDTEKEKYNSETETHYVRYYFKDHEIFVLDGFVVVREKLKNLRLSADRVFYYRDLNFYKTYGSSKYEDLKQKMTIKGDRFEYYDDKNIVYSKGNSSLDYLERTIYSGLFLYSRDKNQAVFYGAPYMLDRLNNRLQANVIRYDANKDTLLFDGNISGEFQTETNPISPSVAGQ